MLNGICDRKFITCLIEVTGDGKGVVSMLNQTSQERLFSMMIPKDRMLVVTAEPHTGSVFAGWRHGSNYELLSKETSFEVPMEDKIIPLLAVFDKK